MKHTARLLHHVLAAVVLTVTAVIATAAGQDGARIEFDSRSYDFGVIHESAGPVSTTFRYTNTGTAPLVIVSARASCGCTRPVYPQAPVKPGKSGKIKVTYNPAGRPGEFTKTIKVRTNAKKDKKITLRIKGVVIPKD